MSQLAQRPLKIQNFAAMILGGTGQVGVARDPGMPGSRYGHQKARCGAIADALDIAAADFSERTAALTREVLSQGPVSAVSCVGEPVPRAQGPFPDGAVLETRIALMASTQT